MLKLNRISTRFSYCLWNKLSHSQVIECGLSCPQTPVMARSVHQDSSQRCPYHMRLKRWKRSVTDPCPLLSKVDAVVSSMASHYPICQITFLSSSSRIEKKDGLEDLVAYEEVVNETLESLSEYFDNVVEEEEELCKDGDVSLSSGVLTVNLGSKFGIYVINQQTPNRQIWLSSPVSGPKRYDFVNGHWIYKHDGISLHNLLSKELSKLFNKEFDFTSCSYGKPS